MKKLSKVLTAVLTAALIVTGCGSSKNLTLNVGATALPHAEILNFIKEDLAKEGVELTVTEFGDYTLLNQALADGQIDANFFQHIPYLENFCKDSGEKLVSAGKIHVEPIGIYSKSLTDLAQLQEGAVVGIPSDATNEGRALLLLETLNLIKLKEGVGLAATLTDITENTKKLEFMELEASIIPRTLEDTDISIINTNYALEAGLNPSKDAIAIEGSESPYANVIAVNEKDKDSEAIKKLVKVLQTQKVKDFILEQYEGGVVPAF